MTNRFTILFCVLCCTTGSLSAQNKQVTISGVIKNSLLKPIEDAYILNINSKNGTVTNGEGFFEINVSIGDWLVISNIQYLEKKIHITEKIIEEKRVQIHLADATNQLEEVFIKKRMTGNLADDRLKNQKDTIKKIDPAYYNFSKMDLSNLNMGNLKKPLDARKLTDPTTKNAPVMLTSVSIPNFDLIKKRALRKKLAFKTALPDLLKKELGEHFFFSLLKIPKTKLNHFIEYCRVFGIEQLYKKGNILRLIEIFRKESPGYLKMIQKKE